MNKNIVTLEDVITAVQDVGTSDTEAVAALRHLIASRRVIYARPVQRPYRTRHR